MSMETINPTFQSGMQDLSALNQSVQPGENKNNSISNADSLNKNVDEGDTKNIKSTNENKTLGPQDIQESLQVINQLIPIKNTNVVFKFDDTTKPPIINVIDKENNEVIRQIPSENLQKIAKALSDMADSIHNSGILFNSKI